MLSKEIYNIDSIIVGAYVVIIFLVGIYNRATPGSLQNYSHIEKSIRTNRLILAATIFATAVGGGTTFGLTEKTFSGNTAYSYALILTIPIDILIGIYIVPKISKYYGAISIGDIMWKHYGNLGRVMAGIGVVVSSAGYLAAQISVSGYLLSDIFGLNYISSLIISYTMLIIYTSIGGLRSIIISHSLQFCAMIIGIPLLSFFGLQKLGILDFLANIPVEKYSLNNDIVLHDTILLALSFSVVGCYPTLLQRAMLNKESRYVTQAIIIKSIIYAFFIACITLNGFISYELFPNSISNMAMLNTINEIVPSGIRAIVIIGFLSAAMSTADTDLNIAALSVSRDIFMPLFNIKTPSILVMIAKITTIIIGLTALYISINFTNVVDIVLTIAALWAPFIVVPFIGAIFGKEISKTLLVVNSLCAIIGCYIWEKFAFSTLKGVFVGTVINLICFIISYHYVRRK